METIPQTFARRDLTLSEAEFAVLGIPYDSSESYRTGSRYGPNAIRAASKDLEDYDMEEGFDLLDLKICDIGDLEVSFGDFQETRRRSVEAISTILEGGAVPICLGGEHTIAYFSAEAVKRGTCFVIYDGHLDYREDYLGNRFSHASAARRISEVVGPENVILIGARSGQKEELDDSRRDGILHISSLEFNRNREDALKRLSKFTRNRSVYLSIDLDVMDPSEAPGVCNPEPGGIYYRDILESFSFLRNARLVGLDLCELTPEYDSYSPVLAAKLIFKALVIYKS